MPKTHSLIDRLYYANRREYTVKDGNVTYLDGTPLQRPTSMPLGQRILLIGIVVAAIILGAVFVNNTVLASIRETEAAKQAVVDNLARQASIETIPIMADMIELDDGEVRDKFAKDGFTVYNVPQTDNSDDMILYKLASDVSESEAAAMLSQGINGLTAAQATKLLNGSWYFASEHSGATSMVVRYADFSTADPAVAVQKAITKEGLDPATVTESGVDDSGNTYSMGTLEKGDKSYSWKVSALPLSDMYSVAGMPENACYVGVRITKK